MTKIKVLLILPNGSTFFCTKNLFIKTNNQCIFIQKNEKTYVFLEKKSHNSETQKQTVKTHLRYIR